MEFLQAWLPLLLGVVAVLIAVVVRRSQGETIELEGVLDDSVEYLSDGAEFVQEMTPAAITIVQGLRQRYKNGELALDDLKPMAVEQLGTLFPHWDDDRLGLVVEGAVFAVKSAARELWRRTESDAKRDAGEIPS